MAKYTMLAGEVSQMMDIAIQDVSNASGALKTGLVATDVALFYHRNTSATTSAISFVNATIGTWTSSGFTEVGGGLYQIGLPNAALASGASYVAMLATGTKLVTLPIEIQLVGANPDLLSVFSNADSVLLASHDYSSAVTVGAGIATPSKVTVQLQSLDYSSAVTVGVGIATPSKVTVQVSANNDKTGYTITAGDYSSTVTFGTGTIKAATYSGVTVGAGDYAAKDMSSALTVGVGIATPSKVTVQVSANNDKAGYTIAPGAYSTVTFDAREVATVLDKTGYTASTVGDKTGYSLAAADYSSSVTVGVGIAKPSGVSVRLESVDYSSAVTVGAGIAAPSKVTVQLQSLDYSSKVTTGVGIMAAGVIATAQFGVGAIDNTVLSQNAAQEVADRTLLRNIASGSDGGRTVLSALRALRNRNDIETGVLTVYQENDTTSAWTATVSTTTGNPVNQIAPSS